MILRFNLLLILSAVILISCEDQNDDVFDGVVINEFLARNDTTNQDSAGDFDDWLELFNSTPEAIDLAGYFLTDNLNDPDKFELPVGTVIPAEGFLLFWADGEPEEGLLHCSFKLSGSGEEIGLYNPEGSLVDEIAFGEQGADISWGRYPDGSDDWQYFGNCDSCLSASAPTPGTTNNWHQ